MSNVIQQWAPEAGHIRRQLPSTSEHWSPAGPVARYLKYLRALDLKDPTGAEKLYQVALELRERSSAAAAAAKPDGEAEITRRLAMGEIDAEQASRLLAKVPRQEDVQEKEARDRVMIQDATRRAYGSAVRAIHDYGDRWLELLRPLVQAAVDAQDQERWDALHRLAGWLRSPALSALEMIAIDPSGGLFEFGEPWRYTVRRPDLYHAWRLEHAERTHAGTTELIGPSVFVAYRVTAGPHPTLADMVQGEMEPGLHSASEVLAITEAILAEQEAARTSAEPPPRRSRHAPAEVS